MKKLLVTLLSCLTLVNSCGYTGEYEEYMKKVDEHNAWQRTQKLYSVDFWIASHIYAISRDINNLYLDTNDLPKYFGCYSKDIRQIAGYIYNIAKIMLREGCYLIGINESLENVKNQINEISKKFKFNIIKVFHDFLQWCDELIEANTALQQYEQTNDKTRILNYRNFLDDIQNKYKQLRVK